jgi:hypothetical protein
VPNPVDLDRPAAGTPVASTTRDPLTVPKATGVKRASASQLAEGESVAPHVVAVTAKGAVAVIDVIGAGTVFGFVMMNLRVALFAPTRTGPKSWIGGEMLSVMAATPVPSRFAVTVPVEAGTTNVPGEAPGADGWKKTSVLQPVFGASVGPHVVAPMKYGPVVDRVPRVAATDGDGLKMLNATGTLAVPTVTLP